MRFTMWVWSGYGKETTWTTVANVKEWNANERLLTIYRSCCEERVPQTMP